MHVFVAHVCIVWICRSEEDIICLLLCSTYSSETRSLIPTRQDGQKALGTLLSLASSVRVIGLIQSVLYMSVEDSYSGPHACTARALTQTAISLA